MSGPHLEPYFIINFGQTHRMPHLPDRFSSPVNDLSIFVQGCHPQHDRPCRTCFNKVPVANCHLCQVLCDPYSAKEDGLPYSLVSTVKNNVSLV